MEDCDILSQPMVEEKEATANGGREEKEATWMANRPHLSLMVNMAQSTAVCLQMVAEMSLRHSWIYPQENMDKLRPLHSTTSHTFPDP